MALRPVYVFTSVCVIVCWISASAVTPQKYILEENCGNPITFSESMVLIVSNLTSVGTCNTVIQCNNINNKLLIDFTEFNLVDSCNETKLSVVDDLGNRIAETSYPTGVRFIKLSSPYDGRSAKIALETGPDGTRFQSDLCATTFSRDFLCITPCPTPKICEGFRHGKHWYTMNNRHGPLCQNRLNTTVFQSGGNVAHFQYSSTSPKTLGKNMSVIITSFNMGTNDKCAPFEFQCANKLCIGKDLICNHYNECSDNSDETLPACASLSDSHTGLIVGVSVLGVIVLIVVLVLVVKCRKRREYRNVD